MFVCLFGHSETDSHYVVQVGFELTFVAQAGLELALILLPQPPKCWDYRRAPPGPALFILFYVIYFFIFFYGQLSLPWGRGWRSMWCWGSN